MSSWLPGDQGKITKCVAQLFELCFEHHVKAQRRRQSSFPTLPLTRDVDVFKRSDSRMG